jgi:hypothetical protein
VWQNRKLQLNLFLLVIGIGVASVTTMRLAHAEKDIVVNQQNISGAHNAIDVGKSITLQNNNKASSFAEYNELKTKNIKEKSKTNRIILLLVISSVIVFIYFNIKVNGDNARHCTYCGYCGTMKAKKLCDNPELDDIVKGLTRVLPVFLYFFSAKGRFICPKCQRSSMNKSIKPSIRDLQ